MLRLMLCCLAMAALAIAGCGDSADSTSSSSAGARTTAQKNEWVANPFELPQDGPGAHPGATVGRLIVKDVVVGDGPEIRAGDTGYFEFVLADWTTGTRIDKSWGKKKPFSIRIERNEAIDGWWQGIPGMRVGGRRTLVIPPELGFVNNGNPKVANKTTYFDIVLQGIAEPTIPGLATEEEAAAEAGGGGGAEAGLGVP